MNGCIKCGRPANPANWWNGDGPYHLHCTPSWIVEPGPTISKSEQESEQAEEWLGTPKHQSQERVDFPVTELAKKPATESAETLEKCSENNNLSQ